MTVPAACNSTKSIALMDFAYLATNVYHDPSENKLLGKRPKQVEATKFLAELVNINGWYQLKIPELHLPQHKGMYAEFYVKIYDGKIQHLMVAFRGTVSLVDWEEDIIAWHNAVLEGYKTPLPIVNYWPTATMFLTQVKRVILDLDQRGLLSDRCDYNVTGHSLGAALANLVVSSGIIVFPAASEMKSQCCLVPKVISFNPPGIMKMPGVLDTPFLQGQVISMRAEYDIVSAIGVPYGFVINNDIAQEDPGLEITFSTFKAQNKLESFTHKEVFKIICDDLHSCNSAKTVLDGVSLAGVVGLVLSKGDLFYEQHIMPNLLSLIAKNPSSLTVTHSQLAHWANTHGGLNHDETALPLYGKAA